MGYHALMGDIAESDTDIVDHIGPLPSTEAGGVAHTVHEVIENAVYVARAQCLVGREMPPQPVELGHVPHVIGPQNRVLVEVNKGRPLHQLLKPLLLALAQGNKVWLDPRMLCQIEYLVIEPRLQVIESPVAIVSLLAAH